MSVRVVARIRPLLKQENARDIIVEAAGENELNIIRIPNPKNESENYSFQFNSVYDAEATQQELFDKEVSPTIKQLFSGLDITLFAYGVTGTGKTHTMRGGKSLADRGVIPRLLSAAYRRARKTEKDSAGDTKVEITLSYYEIYNDRVYDLFEPPEKRTPAGLPIRDNGGKSIVVGLTERPCSSLKDFEQLYDQANVNRSTSATKLNAHSSRSHAILTLRVTQITESTNTTLISSASAIDLAGSEDNRRTDNNKDRLVESAAINKSLFVLAQCVEAISKRATRIPYRESKMTRILSLGQNQGVTVMILNLAPTKSYHLDTISSLNFANRTKKIEVNEIENIPIFNAPIEKPKIASSNIARQPLRPLATTSHNISNLNPQAQKTEKPVKAFSVYSDARKPGTTRPSVVSGVGRGRQQTSPKRPRESSTSGPARPTKSMRPTKPIEQGMSAATIEEMIDRKLEAKLAERALRAEAKAEKALPEDVQRRLDVLERKVAEKEESSEGLQFLLMAKQHSARGEDVSALKMYKLALPYYPSNTKLQNKITAVEERIRRRKEESETVRQQEHASTAPLRMIREDSAEAPQKKKPTHHYDDKGADADADADADYHDEPSEDHLAHDDDASDSFKPTGKSRNTNILKPTNRKLKVTVFRDTCLPLGEQTPRTKQLINIINSRDVSQIKTLKGVGVKKAEAIVSCLVEMEDAEIVDLEQLGALKGVGWKGVENMRAGLAV